MSEKLMIEVDGVLLNLLRKRQRLLYSDAALDECRDKGVSLVEAIFEVEGEIVLGLRAAITLARGEAALRWQE